MKRPGFPAVLCACLSALACIPLLVSQWPPLFDYFPNLARVFVIHHLMTDGLFSDRYSLIPSIVPNLGMDAVVLPLLLAGVDLSVAGRLFVGFVMVMSAVSVLALHRALFRNASLIPLFAFAFCYNDLLLTGFLTSQLSFALAILFFAVWLRVRRRWHPAICVLSLAAAAAVLFFCHMMGALVLIGLIGSHDVAERLAAWWRPPAPAPDTRAFDMRAFNGTWPALVAASAAIAVLFSASPFNAGDPAETGATFLAEMLRPKPWRLGLLPEIFSAYDPRVDIPVAVVAGLGFLAALAARRVRIAWPMLPAIGGLLLLLVLVPASFHDTWYIPDRLPFVLLLLGIASVDVALPAGFQRRAVIGVIVAMVLARSASAAFAWSEIARLRRPLVAALASLPPSSTVCGAHQVRTRLHDDLRFPFAALGALATIESGAFSTSIFARREWNWLVPRPEWQTRIDAAPKGFNRVDLNPAAPAEAVDMARPAALAACDFIFAARPELYQKPLPPSLRVVVAVPGATLFHVDK